MLFRFSWEADHTFRLNNRVLLEKSNSTLCPNMKLTFAFVGAVVSSAYFAPLVTASKAFSVSEIIENIQDKVSYDVS